MPQLSTNDRLRLIAALKSRPRIIAPKRDDCEDLIAPKEVALLLGISDRTARNMMRGGSILSLRVKKKLWKTSRAELAHYISTQYEIEKQRISPDDGIYPPITSERPPPQYSG